MHLPITYFIIVIRQGARLMAHRRKFRNRHYECNTKCPQRRFSRFILHFVSFPIKALRNAAIRLGGCLFSRLSHSLITAYPP